MTKNVESASQQVKSGEAIPVLIGKGTPPIGKSAPRRHGERAKWSTTLDVSTEGLCYGNGNHQKEKFLPID